MNLTNAPTANTPKRPEEKKAGAASTGKEYINSMFDSALQSQKNQLKQGYDQGKADLDQAQRESQIRRDADLNRTYVEAAKDRKNYQERENAYGLTSGAMAQARLAQDNAVEKDMTLLRLQGEERDRQIEKERSLLGQRYQQAIAKAQADNDMGRAQALYRDAQRAEDLLRQQQMQAGNLMAGVGDFSVLGGALGLDHSQIAALKKRYDETHAAPAAGGGYYGGFSGGAAANAGAGETAVAEDMSTIEYLNKLIQAGAPESVSKRFIESEKADGRVNEDEAKRLREQYLYTQMVNSGRMTPQEAARRAQGGK